MKRTTSLSHNKRCPSLFYSSFYLLLSRSEFWASTIHRYTYCHPPPPYPPPRRLSLFLLLKELRPATVRYCPLSVFLLVGCYFVCATIHGHTRIFFHLLVVSYVLLSISSFFLIDFLVIYCIIPIFSYTKSFGITIVIDFGVLKVHSTKIWYSNYTESTSRYT